jgi:hypothetical protein
MLGRTAGFGQEVSLVSDGFRTSVTIRELFNLATE